MHDGIELEKRHVPAAVIITDLFIDTAKLQVSISGIPTYPFAVIPHPISRLGEDELRDRAEKATGQILSCLNNVSREGRS
ncbi:hypothetical protein ACFLV5_00550 [Chloroflexota bacterium]